MGRQRGKNEIPSPANKILTGIQSGIVFIYFQDYVRACNILETNFGFIPRTDFGYAQMFEICPDYFICAVKLSDVPRSYQIDKSVTLCFAAPTLTELALWHQRLIEKGVSVTALEKSGRLEYYAFKAEGPEGYNFEFGHFMKPEEAIFYNPPNPR